MIVGETKQALHKRMYQQKHTTDQNLQTSQFLLKKMDLATIWLYFTFKLKETHVIGSKILWDDFPIFNTKMLYFTWWIPHFMTYLSSFLPAVYLILKTSNLRILRHWDQYFIKITCQIMVYTWSNKFANHYFHFHNISSYFSNYGAVSRFRRTVLFPPLYFTHITILTKAF